MPTSNTEYWEAKISRTKARDRQHAEALARMGWCVLTIWECELGDRAELMGKIEGFLQATDR